MSQRIVIYQAGRHAADAELLSAIADATGTETAALAKLLRTRRAVYLNGLDDETVGGLGGLLEDREVDFEVESMTESPDRAGWLEEQIGKWVKRGHIGWAAANAIRRDYGLEVQASAAPPVKTAADPRTLVRAVLALGAVLVGLGMVLFVASNWERIPDPVKIGGSLALSIAALVIGDRLRSGGRARRPVGRTALLIALFGIGGVILLIAQTYHVVADSYWLPLLWGGLCAPVGLLQRFKPALYLASLLWLWSYWLHAGSHDQLFWPYALLLLGFLLPYGRIASDKVFFQIHLVLLQIAMVSTLVTDDFWLCSAWLAALVALRVLYREPLYDWLLLAGSVWWHLAYLIHFDEGPNPFYLVPVAYFLYRGLSTRSNWLLLAATANAWFWLATLSLGLIERFDFEEPTATGVALWLLGSGLAVYGIGVATRRAESWAAYSAMTRYGGALLGGFMVFILSFRFYADEPAFFESLVVMIPALALGAVGLVLAGPALLAQKADGWRRRWTLAVLALTALALFLAAVVTPSTGLNTLVFNLILFVMALGMMIRGHRETHIGWYNAGIGLFVVLIASRYFDTFVDLLPRSVFFVAGGAFLIVWAILVDRQRRRRAARSGGAPRQEGATR